MQRTQSGDWQRSRLLASWVLAVMLVVSMGILSGCATSTGTSGGGSAESDTADEATTAATDEASEQEADAASQDAESDEPALVEVPYEFADECTDRRGDISVYALCELTGADLSVLLEQQDYVWSSQDQMWLKNNGSAALVACAPSTSYLNREQIEELGRAVDEAGVSYRIVTSRYSNPRRAYDGLVSRVMTSEDVEYTDLGVVGVVQGVDPETRALVVVTEGDEVMVVSVYGSEALAAGLLDEMAGRELGSTIEDAFESLVGRPLETTEE